MKNYLVTIEFDCNDADYVYGLQVINEEQKAIIDRNLNKEMSFGSYDFGGGKTCTLANCISIQEINDNDVQVLTKLKLLNFGEGKQWWINDLDEADVFEEE